MEKPLKKLKEVIAKQVRLLGIIKTIEKTKNEILSQGKLMDFSALNENQTSLMEENLKLEKEREKILEEMGAEIRTAGEQRLKFTQILNRVSDPSQKRELEDLFGQLKAMVGEIKALTSMNQELIEVALQVIDLTLSQGEISREEIDYTRKAAPADRPLLINKLI